MQTLTKVLRKPIVDNARTRNYQSLLDNRIDEIKANWNLQTGLVDMPNSELPHQQIENFFRMNHAERKAALTPEMFQRYERNSGRGGTAPLCQAAFCYYSPLSRHRGDKQLIEFFQNGFRYHLMGIQEDGFPGANGLNGEAWAHGWDIEGLIYGLVFLGDEVDDELVDFAKKKMRLAADRMLNLRRKSSTIGSYGNQRLVYALGLYLYSEFLGDQKYLDAANFWFEDAITKVLDDTGQVVEQYGPCMHYSYTAFIYAWLNIAVRNDDSYRDQIASNLEFFLLRHTESLYPIAGPSTRQYYEVPKGTTVDLLPAAEQLADVNVGWRDYVDRVMKHLSIPTNDTDPETHMSTYIGGHGASPVMWAILMAKDESKWAKETTAPQTPSEHWYTSSEVLKRAPFRYLLIRRRYQTHFNSRDFLPFSGVQTWALDNEPPIIHPTKYSPSTTIGIGLDTARQGVSHNWGGYGAGNVGIDSYTHPVDDENDQFLIVARYDWMWRVHVFTDVSTVQIEFGKGGDRTTQWTLNRIEPTVPHIASKVVTFKNRKACLHTSIEQQPELCDVDVDHEEAKGSKQLHYVCGSEPTGFALSDDSFGFDSEPLMQGNAVRFHDATGKYELRLDERLLDERNPGNFGVDVFNLAAGTTAKKL